MPLLRKFIQRATPFEIYLILIMLTLWIRSDTESAGRYSRSEVDGQSRGRKPKISLSRLFKRNKDKVSGADTDTMRTVVTVDDEKVLYFIDHTFYIRKNNSS